MRFILFLYLLIVGYANAERYMELKHLRGFAKRKPFGQAAPFPSLPAAVHWQDSADIWRKSLGAAKTGSATLPSGSSIPILKHIPTLHLIKNKAPHLRAADYYKRFHGNT